MKQKIRSEININDTWDLTYIFKNDDEFNKTLEHAQKDLKKIGDYKGRILNNSQTLLSFLEVSDEIERELYKLYYYAHLSLDVDTTNTKFQEQEGRVTNLLQEYSVLTSFVIPELLKEDYSIVEKYLQEESKLAKYRFNLESIYRYKKHSLSEEIEKMLSTLSKSFTSEETFEALTDADMTFPNIKVNGKMVELTESNYNSFIRSQDRNLRKKAFTKLLSTYEKYKNTLAKTFSGNVELLTSMAKIKHFNSSLEASLYKDNINTDVYNKLIEIINNNLPVLYKYYDLKKECLKVNKLHLYDIYVPMVENINKSYTFDEAKDIVMKALSVLGEDYLHNLQKAFDERWIDKYNSKGKRGGAYSSGFYDTKPYLLLNFEGKYEDVTTLAHELGHSMHTYYSCHNQPYNLSSYNIFVAEVASTVNELLLVHFLIKKSKDKKEKLFLLNQLMELYKGTIFRQVMFAEFERDMHADLEKGKILTNEYLSSCYYRLVKKYFGDNVVCDELIKNEWMRIPHFYYDFYVYKYAIGLSCATKIVQGILNGERNALENYLSFLKTGGSMYPADELKIAGVSVFDNDVYLSAIKAFEDIINDFHKIYNSEE